MESSYGAGLGLKNQFNALLLDESEDPLDAIKKTSKKQKKINPKKNTNKQIHVKDLPPKKQVFTNIEIPCLITSNVKPIVKTDEEKAVFKRELTLDEYKESVFWNRRLGNTPKYNLRQPGEGEDLSQWEKLVPLEKKKYEDKEQIHYESNASELSQRAGRLKHLPVNVTFADGFARRGRGRSGLGAVASSSNISEVKVYHLPLQVDNEEEFPFLGE